MERKEKGFDGNSASIPMGGASILALGDGKGLRKVEPLDEGSQGRKGERGEAAASD